MIMNNVIKGMSLDNIIAVTPIDAHTIEFESPKIVSGVLCFMSNASADGNHIIIKDGSLTVFDIDKYGAISCNRVDGSVGAAFSLAIPGRHSVSYANGKYKLIINFDYSGINAQFDTSTKYYLSLTGRLE